MYYVIKYCANLREYVQNSLVRVSIVFPSVVILIPTVNKKRNPKN